MPTTTISPDGAVYHADWIFSYTDPPFNPVGTPPEWAVGDDSSYVDVTIWDAHGHFSPEEGGPITGHFLEHGWAMADFTPDTDVIGLDLDSVVVRCQNVGSYDTTVAWEMWDVSTQTQVAYSYNVPVTGAVADITVPLQNNTLDAAEVYLAGNLGITVYPNSLAIFDVATDLRVFGVWVTADVESVGIHPLRRWPPVNHNIRHWPRSTGRRVGKSY